MTYGDIARAVTATLYDLFPGHEVYSVARTEDFRRPCFFFHLKPIMVDATNKRLRHNVISLYLDYHQDVKDEVKMYDAVSRIRDELGWKYKVGDEYINVMEISWDLVGRERNVMQISITFEYFDSIHYDEHAEMVESVDVTYHLKEEI